METHSAVVVFVGDRAYKVKKPVDLGFLDFSTREARERACHREVALNRRFSPDVYLGVADVLGPDGTVCDHMVVMRRLPADRRLATLLARGDGTTDCLRAIARQLAVVHAIADTSRTNHDIASVATRDAVAANWLDNVETLERFAERIVPRDEIEHVRHLADRYLAGRARLFDHRIETGQVRDGHGDLLAEDIFCLDDGPRIIDCLEFADRYRYGDVLLDVGFLAMDLERLDHAGLSGRFLDWYGEFSGEHHPHTLAHHYIAYRAHVRAKVACLRYEQGDTTMAATARALHRMALQHLEPGQVALVLVGGLPGTGKSTVAAGLSDALGWTLLRSDEVRKDLAGLGHSTSARGPIDGGLYEPHRVDRAYQELLARARTLLELGEPVILDATWTSARQRRAAAEVAAATSSELVQLKCHASPPVARARLAARRDHPGPSDATQQVRDMMADRADPWPEAAIVRTDVAVDDVLASARAAVASQLERHVGTRGSIARDDASSPVPGPTGPNGPRGGPIGSRTAAPDRSG